MGEDERIRQNCQFLRHSNFYVQTCFIHLRIVLEANYVMCIFARTETDQISIDFLYCYGSNNI